LCRSVDRHEVPGDGRPQYVVLGPERRGGITPSFGRVQPHRHVHEFRWLPVVPCPDVGVEECVGVAEDLNVVAEALKAQTIEAVGQLPV